MMLQEAYQALGLGPEADSQTIETTYWRRARHLAEQRDRNPDAAEELERVNWAYQTLMNHRLHGPPIPRVTGRASRRRRFAYAGVALALAIGGLIAGLGYREDIRGGAERGVEETQQGWDDTITWLQSLDDQPTPTPQSPRDITAGGN